MPILAPGKRSVRNIYVIIEQGLSNFLPREKSWKLEICNFFKFYIITLVTTKILPSDLMLNQNLLCRILTMK